MWSNYNKGVIEGFPKSSQVLYVMTFTCVSSSRTQSMSKSHILASRHSFSLKISDKLTCRWSFKVSFICSNTFSYSFWDSTIILVYGSSLGFSWFKFILPTLEIILGKSNTSWSIFTTEATRSSTRAFLSQMSRSSATVTKG